MNFRTMKIVTDDVQQLRARISKLERYEKGNRELCKRITEYLCVGGLFNPEAMEHNKVRDLLIDCREALKGGE